MTCARTKVTHKQRRSAVEGGRTIFYRSAALGFPAILDAIAEQLQTYEEQTGQAAWDLAPQLLEDDGFIEQLVEFAKTVPVVEEAPRGL